jgi:hypothetical protein
MFDENEKLLGWLKDNMPPDAVITEQNPALVHLYTGLKSRWLNRTKPQLGTLETTQGAVFRGDIVFCLFRISPSRETLQGSLSHSHRQDARVGFWRSCNAA